MSWCDYCVTCQSFNQWNTGTCLLCLLNVGDIQCCKLNGNAGKIDMNDMLCLLKVVVCIDFSHV